MADVVINGSDIFVYIDGAKIAHATSHTLSMTMATRGTSNKDTGKFNTKAPGRLGVTATSDSLIVYADIATMMEVYLLREPVHLHFAEDDAGSPDTAKFYAEGDFIISDMEINAADEANASCSCTFDHYEGFTWAGDTALLAGVIGTNCSENAADDGFAACFPRGGAPPYTFLWSTTAITQYIIALAPGTYTVTVTDDASGTATGSITITEPPA